jgi:hypothetical protein
MVAGIEEALMILLRAALVLSALDLLAFPLRAQLVAPVGVRNHVSSFRSIAVGIEPDQVGAAPFVIIGALVGAGAVTDFWVHEAVVSARKNGNDGMIIPPIIFVTIGAGGVGGGVLGWMVHDAMTHPRQE